MGGVEGAFYKAQKNEIKDTHTHTYTLNYAPEGVRGGQEGGTQQLLFTPKMWSDLWAGEGEFLRSGVREAFGPDSPSK